MRDVLRITVVGLVLFAIAASGVHGQRTRTLDREWEPVVISASRLPYLQGVPVAEIFLYAYDEGTGTWSMIPFQIDEQTFGPDPLSPSNSRWFYFIPEEWSGVDTIGISEHNGVFDGHDELVFMVRDLGDRAPGRLYIDDDDAKRYSRVELVVQDPQNSELTAYAYAFRSSTITEAIPRPYDLAYDAAADSILAKYYTLGLNANGTVDGVVIREPGGNGKDLVDLLKIRFSGVMDFAFPLPISTHEGILYQYPGRMATADPVVRLIRFVNMSLKIGEFVAENARFPVTAKFYPFSGTIKGGSSLWPDDLKVTLGGEEVLIILRSLRESWDYNSNAVGMKFFNQYNSDVPIDGVPDVVDTTVDIPIRAWDLTTGAQGSIFKLARFKEQKWQGVNLYYYDNKDGGQGDSYVFGPDDTGDLMSYGDNGILFRNKEAQDSVTIELDYLVYFLPRKDMTRSDADMLVYYVSNPVEVSSFLTAVEGTKSSTPVIFCLYDNFPNPFNGSTLVRFSIPQSSHVEVEVFDSRGRLARTLAEGQFTPGTHTLVWDGRDNQKEPAPSGVYLCRLLADGFSQSIKLLLVR